MSIVAYTHTRIQTDSEKESRDPFFTILVLIKGQLVINKKAFCLVFGSLQLVLFLNIGRISVGPDDLLPAHCQLWLTTKCSFLLSSLSVLFLSIVFVHLIKG